MAEQRLQHLDARGLGRTGGTQVGHLDHGGLRGVGGCGGDIWAWATRGGPAELARRTLQARRRGGWFLTANVSNPLVSLLRFESASHSSSAEL